MKLEVLPEVLAIARLEAGSAIPEWAMGGRFFSVHRTREELSIVCEEKSVPEGTQSNPGWRAIQVQGPLDFSLTGILASIATPLAAAKISIFALSTYDTDYVLVKAADLDRSIQALKRAGFSIK